MQVLTDSFLSKPRFKCIRRYRNMLIIIINEIALDTWCSVGITHYKNTSLFAIFGNIIFLINLKCPGYVLVHKKNLQVLRKQNIDKHHF